MKKVFLPLAVAAALLLGSKAQAQVPEWINFQGVCTVLSGTPTVHFVILDEDDTVVYAETQQVTTNAKGAFTAQIGNGTLAEGSVAFDALEWAGKSYTLSVDINGNEVATGIAFGSVPYALVAESVGSLSGQEFDNMVENLEGLIPVVDTLVEDLDLVKTGLGEAESTIMEIVQKNMEQQTEINGLIALTEGLEGTEQAVLELTESNIQQQTAINMLLAQYGALNERNENIGEIALKNHAAIEAMQAGIITAQQDIMEIVQKNMEQQTDINALKADMANIIENMDMSAPLIEGLVEDVDMLKDGLAISQQDIMDIIQTNMEQQTDINVLKADFANVVENLEMFTPMLEVILEDIENLQKVSAETVEGLQTAQQDIMDIVQKNMEQQTEINELRLDVNTALEHANKAGEIAVANFESIVEINEKLEAQKTELDDLRVLVQLQGEAIGSLQQQVIRLTEIVNGLRN